ncbi:MAG: tetratricopeptide repeat protein [Desulfomonilia bacterium]
MIVLLIIVSILLVYAQVGSHDFINFDDQLYVTDNPIVKAGITWNGITWAFSFSDRTYWHPLTWFSHMVDCELFGLNPGKHHLVNVFLHIINSILLFLVFMMMTGTLWRSAFVAFLFALHPINVDSVAWIAERKNLLSTLFCMLTIMAYIYYSRRPSFYKYILILFVFMLGLLSKPMLISIPFVLLLLDFWPLKRINFDSLLTREHISIGVSNERRAQRTQALKLIIEKIPLLILSLVIICTSIISFQHHSDVISSNLISIKLRMANALVSYVTYIGKLIWPRNLTIYYPFPAGLPLWEVVGASVFLCVATILAGLYAKKFPYLIVGWLWYLGTLVPVSGLIQVGLWPAMAERWVYIPAIGLFMLVAWLIPDLVSEFRFKNLALSTLAIMVICILMILTWKQTGYWKNDFTLFSHALQVNERNSVAYSNLGDYYISINKPGEAIEYYDKSVEINPYDPLVQNNFAIALLKEGRYEESIKYFKKAILSYPRDPQLYSGLGSAFAHQNRNTEAIEYFSKSLDIDPSNAEVHFDLAYILSEERRFDEAIINFKKVLSINSSHVGALFGLSAAYSKKKDYNAAMTLLKKILDIQPDNPNIYYNIACIYAKMNKADESITWLNDAVQKGFSNWSLIKTDNDLNNIRNHEGYKRIIQGK